MGARWTIGRRTVGRFQVRPGGWNEGGSAVGERESQVQRAVPVHPAQYAERVALQRMPLTRDPNAVR